MLAERNQESPSLQDCSVKFFRQWDSRQSPGVWVIGLGNSAYADWCSHEFFSCKPKRFDVANVQRFFMHKLFFQKNKLRLRVSREYECLGRLTRQWFIEIQIYCYLPLRVTHACSPEGVSRSSRYIFRRRQLRQAQIPRRKNTRTDRTMVPCL